MNTRLSCTPLCWLIGLLASAIQAQTTFTLNPLTTFGPNGDGSIRPGQSIGTSPISGNDVQISAPGGYGIQPGDSTASPNSTAGFNQRGLAFDPVSGNLVFVDTHAGSGGTTITPTNAAIYILSADTGQIKGALNTTNGVITNLRSTGIGTFACAGVSDDGVVYAANQINASSSGFSIYRWSTADPNNPEFGQSAVVAFTNAVLPNERLGQTMAVRGSGTNTQIILGTSSAGTGGAPGTNVFLFDTADGTNFVVHRLYFPGITTPVFNDGIAFGPGNTFWTKQVGKPLLFLAYDPVNYTNAESQGTIIASYSAASPNDPLLNLSAIAVDNANGLLAGLEEIGGTATGGNGKVWLYAIPNPTNSAPAILGARVYVVNFQKTTAPMGYLAFGNGRLFAHASNNGLLVNTLDPVPTPLPSYLWTDYDLSGFEVIRNSDLPSTTRVSVGQTAHFEVIAVPGVTNYQWFTNGVPIPGANQNRLDVPDAQAAQSGIVYQVVASNAAGSSNSAPSTLEVVAVSDFFHLEQIWSFAAGATNYITSTGGGATPNERCLAYHARSNQLLVVRGPAAFANVRIFVLKADTGEFQYFLNTNGLTSGGALNLCGIGVADDGAVYACSVNAAGTADQSFRIYRWADTDPSTLPELIYGTNSSAGTANPVGDLTGAQLHRFGDALAVRGSGMSTEIIVDNQNNPTKYAAVLRPMDNTMTNWESTPLLLQNIQGSYGAAAYGAQIGRGIQFGAGNSFWQKRPNITAAGVNSGAPLAQMGYTPGGGPQVSPLLLANLGLPIFTNGEVALNFVLKVAAAVNFGPGAINADVTSQNTLEYYDITDPSQAVYLGSQNLPNGAGTTRKANNNAIAQVIFGNNPDTGTNYVFAIVGNNGISAYVLAGGVTPPPKLLTQPKSLRLLEGSSGSMSVTVDQTALVRWFKGTNSPAYTGVSGNVFNFIAASSDDAGDYFAVVTNINGSVTSQVARVSVGLVDDNFTLTQVWSAAPGSPGFPYVSSDGGANTPNERSFAYHAPSNQLIVVRCPVSSTAYTVSVVNATSGAFEYNLDTTGVIHQGTSEVAGSNPIDLVAVAVAEDGAVYVCSETPNASGGQFGDPTKMLHMYRWADSGPGTTPVLVFEGDPSDQPPGLNLRWGDALTARGSGTNTELILNSYEGNYGAVLKPIDASLTVFTNRWFYDSAGGGSIGRSIQFGTNNTVFEKRKGSPLFLSRFNVTNQISTLLLTVNSSSTLGGVAVDAARNLAVGVDFVGSSTSPFRPDAVALYEISDPATPMLLNRYDFPVNRVANANFICQTVIDGSRVFSLDANNGLVAFYLNPPLNAMILNIQPDPPNVHLSWGNPAAVLQSSPTLNPPTWTDLAGPGVTNTIQPADGSGVFYRLIQRR